MPSLLSKPRHLNEVLKPLCQEKPFTFCIFTEEEKEPLKRGDLLMLRLAENPELYLCTGVSLLPTKQMASETKTQFENKVLTPLSPFGTDDL